MTKKDGRMHNGGRRQGAGRLQQRYSLDIATAKMLDELAWDQWKNAPDNGVTRESVLQSIIHDAYALMNVARSEISRREM